MAAPDGTAPAADVDTVVVDGGRLEEAGWEVVGVELVLGAALVVARLVGADAERVAVWGAVVLAVVDGARVLAGADVTVVEWCECLAADRWWVAVGTSVGVSLVPDGDWNSSRLPIASARSRTAAATRATASLRRRGRR
ncbi:MAG TPA: hypothetical protein VHS54_10080, partial [Jatrophihabitans sp.]|nr:hypothetical protein [Jatrophihabitans sp.]